MSSDVVLALAIMRTGDQDVVETLPQVTHARALGVVLGRKDSLLWGCAPGALPLATGCPLPHWERVFH